MSLSCLSQVAVLQQLEGCYVASKPWRHLWRNRTSSRRLRPAICGSIQAESFSTQDVWKLIWTKRYHRAGRTSRTSWSWNRRVQIAAPPEVPRSVDVDMLMLRIDCYDIEENHVLDWVSKRMKNEDLMRCDAKFKVMWIGIRFLNHFSTVSQGSKMFESLASWRSP